MAVVESLVTAFQVTGLSATIAAMNQAASATTKVHQAQLRYNASLASGKGMLPAWNALQSAQSQALGNAITVLQTGLSVVQQITTQVERATQAYLEFGKQVLNVKGLTGASTQDAVRAVTLSRVAGIEDTQALREILRMSRASLSPEGQGALAQIGVIPNIGESGLKLFSDIQAKLAQMPDGIRKSTLEMEIFGARSVAALQPLLRMTPEQVAETRQLADEFDSKALPAVQAFQVQLGMLGQRFLIDLVIPIAQMLLPAVQAAIATLSELLKIWKQMNDASGGLLNAVAIVGALGLAFASTAATVMELVKAVGVLNIALKATAMWDAIIDALSGPSGWAALAVAGLVGAGLYFSQTNSANDSQQQAADTMKDAANQFSGAVDNFSKMRGPSIPRAMSQYDINAGGMIGALGGIGGA